MSLAVDSYHKNERGTGAIMGWNFGGALITFDFRAAVGELLEPARRQFVTGHETAEEAQSKALMDTGLAVFEALGLPVVADDAPISFDDATSRDFDGYAVGVVGGKTLLLGRTFGLDQEALMDAYARVSADHGPVLAFWCNDASGTYMISVFRNGTRIRFIAAGPGIDENHGALVDGESAADMHGHDRLMAMVEAAAGCSFANLSSVPMERFSPC